VSLFQSLRAYLGIRGAAATTAPYLWGPHPAHRKKFGVSARGKLKLAIIHRYPDPPRAEPGAGVTGKACEHLLILQ